jgi:serine/threonine protein phosphatase PrpC
MSIKASNANGGAN